MAGAGVNLATEIEHPQNDNKFSTRLRLSASLSHRLLSNSFIFRGRMVASNA